MQSKKNNKSVYFLESASATKFNLDKSFSINDRGIFYISKHEKSGKKYVFSWDRI